MRYKKAQGLSITTIIVAAIALIVLVVLIAIFTGRIGVFSKGVGEVGGDITRDCTQINEDYQIRESRDDCTVPGGIVVPSKDTLTGSRVCCTE